jgi:hypothetical protein
MLIASPLAAYIGEPIRVIEVAPLELPVPTHAPAELPTSPEPEPALEPEEVPAGWSQ